MVVNTLRYLCCTALFLFAGRQAAFAQTPVDPALASLLQEKLDSCVNVYDLPGITASLHLPGDRVWNGASGVSHIFNNTPMDTSLIFYQASVTKMYATAVVMQLVEEGLLSLDDSVGKYLPPLPYVNSKIKLRSLLNHKSGIYDFISHPNAADSWFSAPNQIWDPFDALEAYLAPPYFNENGGFHYSNSNFVMLGLIVEQVTGNAFASELHARILDPYGLNHTFFLPADNALAVPQTSGWTSFSAPNQYNTDAGLILNDCSNSMVFTAGALVATSDDVARFVRLLYGGAFLNANSLYQMQQFTAVTFSQNGTGYGLGTMRYAFNGRNYSGHGGDMNGFTLLGVYRKQDDVALSLSINRNSAPRGAIAAALLKIVNEHLATGTEEARPAVDNLRVWPNPASGQVRFSGTSRSGGDFLLEIFDAAGRRCQTEYLENLPAGEFERPVALEALSAGLYVYRLSGVEGVQVGQLELF